MTAPPATPAEIGAAVAAEARLWLGTPYRHQASLRGVGCDCLGLLRGIWRATIGPEPERPGAYTPDWSETTGEERLLRAARRWLTPVARDHVVPGDVLVFRMRAGGPAKHLGVQSASDRLIHAHARHGVVEIPLDRGWRRRLVARFQFPSEA